MISSNGNIFCVTGPLCGEFTGHRWISLTKASDAELWCFLWSTPWINGWLNNREIGDLRRYRALYDVIVMLWELVRLAGWSPLQWSPCGYMPYSSCIVRNTLAIFIASRSEDPVKRLGSSCATLNHVISCGQHLTRPDSVTQGGSLVWICSKNAH